MSEPTNCRDCEHVRVLPLFVTVHWLCHLKGNVHVVNETGDKPITPPDWCPLRTEASR